MYHITILSHSSMKAFFNHVNKGAFLLLVLIGSVGESTYAQQPPIPVEAFFSDSQIYYEIVVSRAFQPGSRFRFFTVTAFTDGYATDVLPDEVVVPVQFSYSLKNGIGLFTGASLSSVRGILPILGPQHVYVRDNLLLSTTPHLDSKNGATFFGVYEYRPRLNETLSLYSRLQLLYVYHLREDIHLRSYVYARLGLKVNDLVFGVGMNLDQFGEKRKISRNFGPFVAYRF